ncbi:pancreatic secretory granule membrane major glycoprotein GP2-like [Saccostrea echinata]|uniref:pancreatic secretory granule membrane major glycoprotein GP2-like n=1 Tax=Saccostrea echinata TaxID=191078 RepID=UPI002A801917|nr:pancreatic secretory granule membrane major glycoprotein GP2-like [Saccostrea echinata]
MATFKVLSVLMVFKTLCRAGGSMSLWNEVSDICLSASSSPVFEDFSRSQKCIFNSTYNLSDRDLILKWYKSNVSMLTHCPELLECGAVYPLWLNGSIPMESDGAVNRTVCRRGRRVTECCDKTYDIRIKNCSTFIAYCLVPATDREERYCFGENKTCEVPPMTEYNSAGSVGDGNMEDDATTMAVVIVSFTLIGAILIVAFLLKYFTLRELPCSFQQKI